MHRSQAASSNSSNPYAKRASVDSLHCVRIQSSSASAPFIIESLSTDVDSALTLHSHGGMAFDIAKDWHVRCGSMETHCQASTETTTHRRAINADTLDIMTSSLTCIGQKVRMQSSVEPMELQSLNHTRHALLLRCPKGGVSVASGAAGINCSTSGNINLQLETAGGAIFVGAHGNKEQNVHIGTASGRTIVHSDLTVKGTLRLVDEAASMEKHASVRIDTANVVRLKCDRSDIPYDFGFVSKRHNGTEAGLVFDHANELFYFARRLGEYRHTAFAPPLEYAGVCLGALDARSKVATPFVDTHHLQCKVIKHPTKIVVNTPAIQCTSDLHARSVHCSERLRTHELHAAESTLQALRCPGRAELGSAVIKSELVLRPSGSEPGGGAPGAAAPPPPPPLPEGMALGAWFAGTVGGAGFHRTLQDAMDADVEVSRVAMQPGQRHNCTALVNQAVCHIDGGGAELEGVLEVTQTCTTLVIENATLRDLTIHTSEEYRATYDPDARIVLRRVHGSLKDCALHLPKGALRIEYADVEFKNPLLGELASIRLLYSAVGGTPWHRIEGAEEESLPH